MASAHAQSASYVSRSFVEPASPGLTVAPPLQDLRAAASARVIVPALWRGLKGNSGQLRLITTANASCRYTVTFTVRSRIAPAGAATDYVPAHLGLTLARQFLLDSGQRGSSAFSVYREPGIGGIVRLRGLRGAVLTRRADIAPAGQLVWSELRVTAASRPGDECHAGTWREALGPTLGDTLATARTRLRFVRAG